MQHAGALSSPNARACHINVDADLHVRDSAMAWRPAIAVRDADVPGAVMLGHLDDATAGLRATWDQWGCDAWPPG